MRGPSTSEEDAAVQSRSVRILARAQMRQRTFAEAAVAGDTNQAVLDERSVAPGTAAMYRHLVRLFLVFVGRAGTDHIADAMIDDGLCRWLLRLFLSGHDLSLGDKCALWA